MVIVNLTLLNEDGNDKCHRYWPDNGSEVHGIFEVYILHTSHLLPFYACIPAFTTIKAHLYSIKSIQSYHIEAHHLPISGYNQPLPIAGYNQPRTCDNAIDLIEYK